MLEFFRKYQKALMVVVAIGIILSFSFFGTYGVLSSFERKKEIVIGKRIDGSDLLYSEVKQLTSLLGMPGVFQRLLLKTGAAEKLANAYFEELKGDWQARLAKSRAAKFYRHSTMPELDAKRVWSQLAPGLGEEMQRLQEMEESGPEFFEVWSKVYSLQERVSPEFVQRVLAYQLQQAGAPMDPRLVHGNFSLFGCRTLEDWFGRNFLDLAAQFILNGSILAEQQRGSVSREEAKADFLKSFGVKEAESESVALWRKVLGFVRWCDEVGEAVLLDPLPFEKMSEFSRETAVLDLYRLPRELCFSQLDDLLAFETYVRLACVKPADTFGVPEKLLPVDKIDPALTATIYRARCGKLEMASLGSSLSLSELWDWQVDEAHWKALQKQFGWLKSAENADGRFAVLEKLDPASRRSVDAWSRMQMIFEHPEWIESAFGCAKMEEREILVSRDWVDGIEVQSQRPFADLLAKAMSKDANAIEALRCYQDGSSLLRVEEIEQVEALKVVSFADAKAKGRIPLEKFLEGEYRRIRSSAPSLFKLESGEWKKFSEVRETAICMIFPDLFREGEKDILKRRFERWAQRMLSSLQAGETLKADGLWNLERVEKKIERQSSEDWMNRDAFILQPGEWSSVHVSTSGEVTFFFVKERMVSSEPVLEQILFAKETLSSEAKRRVADRVLEIAMQKKALKCPLRIEEEK